MPITVGTDLGSYEITALLGKGGMGEVWRARDTKLKRDVAIKILPEAFSLDHERVNRFQREAEVLASLNHPNIGAIYDLQQADDTRFLVLELVEGDTLAERIARGPIPLEDALEIAKQICEALEAAHERGIIHRDLKPANVKITPEGKVKVLDFGLAKATETQLPSATLSNSPTMLSGTMGRMIIGTAAYMSPEQARGREVDKRTDTWAFAAMLYELLTGTPAFHGEDVTDILAAVVRAEPDWSRLPPSTPTKVRNLLRRCLQKDKTLRMQAAGDVRIEIVEALQAPTDIGTAQAAPVSERKVPWAAAAVLFFLAALGLAFVHFREVPPASQSYEFQIAPPPNTRFSTFRVSPDGRAFAFIATGGSVGGTAEGSLWIRMLDSLESHPVPG